MPRFLHLPEVNGQIDRGGTSAGGTYTASGESRRIWVMGDGCLPATAPASVSGR
jgi:hypothetical protein